MGNPASRSCRQIGVSYSAGPPLRISQPPNVVDEHIKVPVLFADPIGQTPDLLGVEVVDLHGDTDPA